MAVGTGPGTRFNPIVQEISSRAGPFSLFQVFAADPLVCYLDSAMGGQKLGRFSVIASRPFAILQSKGGIVRVGGPRGWKELRASPFDVLRCILDLFPSEREGPGGPFAGGAIGYLGYDLRTHIERLPAASVDDIGMPDCHVCFYDHAVVYDHTSMRAWVVVRPIAPRGPAPDTTGEALGPMLGRWLRVPDSGPEALRAARRRLNELQTRLASAGARFLGPKSGGSRLGPSATGTRRPPQRTRLVSNFERRDYLATIARAKDYIRAGDIYQVNLSQRFSVPLRGNGLELFRRLRCANPAPFSAYLRAGGVEIVSASPERFLRLTGRRVETRPIKGTRPRGGNTQEDLRLSAALLASEKDKAEHVMIVDVERNDLGRVCEIGTVKTTELMVLESYATVHHLVSTVEGRLREDKNAIDLLLATFPGGSITGAPKIRAMEIIDELEPTARGIYTGSIFYLGFDGDMDSSIVIRTCVLKDGVAHFSVGGGIVADSDPEAEYEETLDKGRALMEALA